MFPAAAALAWAVLVYIGVDFGFWGKVLGHVEQRRARLARGGRSDPGGDAAGVPVRLSQSQPLACALFPHHRRLAGAFLGSLVALALFDPAVASGIARMSLVLIAFAGFALIVYLSTHGFDRAVLLIPTWFLLVVWVIAAGMTVAGTRHQRHRRPALLGGLVLIVMLIGFTVDAARLRRRRRHRRHRLRRRAPALALTGSGDLIWDWDVSADKVFTSPETGSLLGPEARHAGRPGGEMARGAAPARPGPLPRRARQRARPAPRPPGAGFPAAHARRRISCGSR